MLDGDDLTRSLETPPVSYEPELRQERAWRIARLASLAAWQGVPVVTATVSLLHAVQWWNRDNSPALVEVLIEASLSALRVQRPNLYRSGSPGHGQNVVGVDLSAEFPTCPELIIQQDYDLDSLDRNAQQCVDLWKDATKSARRHR